MMGSTGVAGKVQITKSASNALSCPLFNGDSMHESSAKAANVGVSRRPALASEAAAEEAGSKTGANESRYQRMWLSKLTRTGLLFPEESRPATEEFPGFGGSSSTSTSRRGSSSSIASTTSDAALSTSSGASSAMSSGPLTTTMLQYMTRPPTLSTFTLSDAERLRRASPVLMVLTHPKFENWHREAIKRATGEYGIGILFVPLYKDEEMELSVRKPLDPITMSSFVSSGGFKNTSRSRENLEEELVLRIHVEAGVEVIIKEIIGEVRDSIDIQA